MTSNIPIKFKSSTRQSQASGRAAKAAKLDALQKAVGDAASVAGGLWLSYFFVLFYLLIAVGGVTHKDLFFEHPVRLPFLNVELPLLGFFVVGPVLFLVIHAYVLLHLVLLAMKVRAFDDELQEPSVSPNLRASLRQQLPSNIFVLLLVEPSNTLTGALGNLFVLIRFVSLVFGPIFLLVLFELQFLPYHHHGICWWLRGAVLADVLLLWLLWPSVVSGKPIREVWHNMPKENTAIWWIASLAPVLLVVAVATFPGESADINHPFPWLHNLLVGGDLDPNVSEPTLWSNRLILRGLDVVDHGKLDSEEKIAAIPETVSLRNRDLSQAFLKGANLRKAVFTAVNLDGANLEGADLREAKFKCGGECTHLNGASLSQAKLQGVAFFGTKYRFVSLQGANLQYAQLQGASLVFTDLQGALLNNAQLQGATLTDAKLDGAFLTDARLQNTQLSRASFLAATLFGAQLQGASLEQVDLQGASLANSQLQEAILREVCVWRTVFPDENALDGARVQSPETEATAACNGTLPNKDKEYFLAMFDLEDLTKLLLEKLPAGLQGDALNRIKRLNPDVSIPDDDKMKGYWTKIASGPTELNCHEKVRAEQWKAAGCFEDGAPYVIRSFLGRRRDENISEMASIAEKFLNKECAGAVGLSRIEIAEIEAIKHNTKPPVVSCNESGAGVAPAGDHSACRCR